jgi:hypothetical protein
VIVNQNIFNTINSSLGLNCLCFIGNYGGVQGIYTTGTAFTNLLLSGASDNITSFANDQNDKVTFYVGTASTTTINIYDSINAATASASLSPWLTTAGITSVRAMTWRHDTNELYVFGNVVTQNVLVVRFTRYQRILSSTTPTSMSIEAIYILNGPLDPTRQNALLALYASTSYVTGCEFIDNSDYVIFSIWDPVASRSKLMTLNANLFASNTTVIMLTTYDQYLVGSYNNAAFNNIRLSLWSMRQGPTLRFGYINGTAASASEIRDFTFINNPFTTGSPITALLGMPTEVRGGRILSN